MAIELALGLAQSFESVVSTPSLDVVNSQKYIGIATGEGAVFKARMSSGYASGSNATMKVWGRSTATSGTLKLRVSFEAQVAQDTDSDGFASQVAPDADPTVNATSGIPYDTTWTLDNTELDAVAAGGWFRVKIERISTGDTMTGDFQLGGWAITQ